MSEKTKHYLIWGGIIAMVVGLVMYFTGYASAQTVATTPTTVIQVSPLYELFVSYVVPVLGTLGAILIGWLCELLRKKFGLDIEQKHRDVLQQALTNGAALMITKGGTMLDGKTIDVKSPILALGINYVTASAGDALKHFGLGPEDIALKLAAKLPQVTVPQQVLPENQTAAIADVALDPLTKKE